MKHKPFLRDVPSEVLAEVVDNASSYAEVLRHFGYACASSSYKALKRRMVAEGIDINKLEEKARALKKKNLLNFRRIPLSRILTTKSKYRGNLRARLLDERRIEVSKADIKPIGRHAVRDGSW